MSNIHLVIIMRRDRWNLWLFKLSSSQFVQPEKIVLDRNEKQLRRGNDQQTLEFSGVERYVFRFKGNIASPLKWLQRPTLKAPVWNCQTLRIKTLFLVLSFGWCILSPKYESQKTQRKGVRRWDLLVDTQTGAIPLESICQYQAKLRRHTD
jgi:hypothetical protein